MSVCTHEFMKEQGWKTPEITVGWDTYVSDDIGIDEFQLAACSIATSFGNGGRCLTLDGTPAQPDVNQAIGVRKGLGYQ